VWHAESGGKRTRGSPEEKKEKKERKRKEKETVPSNRIKEEGRGSPEKKILIELQRVITNNILLFPVLGITDSVSLGLVQSLCMPGPAVPPPERSTIGTLQVRFGTVVNLGTTQKR
jgi:hypothetical protein